MAILNHWRQKNIKFDDSSYVNEDAHVSGGQDNVCKNNPSTWRHQIMPLDIIWRALFFTNYCPNWKQDIPIRNYDNILTPQDWLQPKNALEQNGVRLIVR